MIEPLREWMVRARAFEREAHAVLSVHEAAPSRVVVLEDTYERLSALNLEQDELMRQALRCVENGLFRAAHVMAWAGFMDFLEEKLASDGLAKVRAMRPAWKARSVEELREYQPEHQIVEAAQAVGVCGKSEIKGLLGLLNKRNECAHPSGYYPLLNETLGYISELLQRIDRLAPKTL
jgi:hypothetical protein